LIEHHEYFDIAFFFIVLVSDLTSDFNEPSGLVVLNECKDCCIKRWICAH